MVQSHTVTTPEHREAVLKRLAEIWAAYPIMQLGQLIGVLQTEQMARKTAVPASDIARWINDDVVAAELWRFLFRTDDRDLVRA